MARSKVTIQEAAAALYVSAHAVLLEAEAGKKLSEKALDNLQGAMHTVEHVRDLRKLVYDDAPNDREERKAAPVKVVNDINVVDKQQPEPVEIIPHEYPGTALPQETPEQAGPVDDQGDAVPPLAQPVIESIKAQSAGVGFFKRLIAGAGA